MESTRNQKFFSKMEKWYLRKVANFPNYLKKEKVEKIEEALSIISLMFKSTNGFHFGKEQYAVLKWKLAQYLQSNEDINVDDVYEAMVLSPSFLEENEDRITTAIDIFKKSKKDELAQRKQQEVLSVLISPEIVIEKISGEYSLVRLMNRLHIDQETEILNHCIGKSDFYINRMMRGEYEVFSLRTFGDIPVATLVYNLKNNKIEQIRKYGDKLLDSNEVFYPALIEALADIKRIKDFHNKQSFSVESKELIYVPDSNYPLFVNTDSFSKKEEIVYREVTVNKFCCVTLVELSVVDLGLGQQKRFNYTEVCDVAKSLGYELCSKEEAYAYALQFPVEQDYSFHFFGMDMTHRDEFFVVGNNGEQHILFLYGKETQMFLSAQCMQYEYKFIFKMAMEGPKNE